MTYFIRKVNNNVDWARPGVTEFPWLPRGDIPADPVTDIRSKDNQISVYELDNSPEIISRVITAIAAKREAFDKVDYVLFESRLLGKREFDFEKTPGDTPDDEINELHRNIFHLSAKKVAKLVTTIILDNKTVKSRELKQTVKELVHDGLQAGTLDKNRVHRNLLSELGML